MKPEDELLFACTRQDFSDTYHQTVLDLCQRCEVGWGAVYQTAVMHGVAPLVYVNLRQCPVQGLGIPQRILDQFKLSLMQNMLQKQRLAENISKAITFFGEKSIDVMLIKGAALDLLVYEQPYYTVLQDADVALRVGRDEISEEQYREFMSVLHRSGVEFDYFEHHDVSMNGILPVDFQRVWDDAMQAEFRGQDVFVMSAEDMLLSVCINSCRKRFFRLKSLCDIAEIISKYPDLKWQALIQKAKTYECSDIVYAALLVTRAAVGADLPDGVLENLAISPTRSTIIRSLIRFASQRVSLVSLYPPSGIKVLGRLVGTSLILPYATLRGYQVRRKIAFVIGDRPGKLRDGRVARSQAARPLLVEAADCQKTAERRSGNDERSDLEAFPDARVLPHCQLNE
jgi:hypothetical protein